MFTYTTTCDACLEFVPAPDDHDPESLFFCSNPACQWEGAETRAALEARNALWNENVMAAYRREMTSSELHRAQDALVAVVKANWL